VSNTATLPAAIGGTSTLRPSAWADVASHGNAVSYQRPTRLQVPGSRRGGIPAITVYRIQSPMSVLEATLSKLADEWHRATRFSSFARDIVLHPAYQRIIGLGPDAVPLLLRRLQKAPDHWFWALVALTGEDPVGPADRGNMATMAARWLAWGRMRGLID
jgi:hypothetical protein